MNLFKNIKNISSDQTFGYLSPPFPFSLKSVYNVRPN